MRPFFDGPLYATRACIKKKKYGKESTLFNSIHKHSFGGLGADTLTFREWTPFYPFVQKSRVYPPLFRSNYISIKKRKERKKERKIVYFLNTAQTYTRIGRLVGIIYRKNLTVQEKN